MGQCAVYHSFQAERWQQAICISRTSTWAPSWPRSFIYVVGWVSDGDGNTLTNVLMWHSVIPPHSPTLPLTADAGREWRLRLAEVHDYLGCVREALALNCTQNLPLGVAVWCDLDRQLWLSSTGLLVSRFPEQVTTLLGVRVISIYWQYTDEFQKNPQGRKRSIEGQIYAQELGPGRFQNQYFMFF